MPRKPSPRELNKGAATNAFRFWAFFDETLRDLMARDAEMRDIFSRIPDMVDRYKLYITWDIQGPQKEDGIRAGLGNPTEAEQLRIARRHDNARAAIKDLEAVQKVFDWLPTQNDGTKIMAALQAVYMTRPDVPYSYLLMTGRVKDYAMENKGEDTDFFNFRRCVYRWLRKARVRWAQERELVIFESTDIY